jgi:hypothetical protein
MTTDIPSRPGKLDRQNGFFRFLTWLCDGYWPLAEHPDDSPVSVCSPSRVYALQHLVAVGDVADIHLATVESESATSTESTYILKMSRLGGGHTLLDNEHCTLGTLLNAAGESSYRKYLPKLVESFPARDGIRKRINVFVHEHGFYTLEQIHEQHPAPDARHLAWIFKRLLTILGFCHRHDTIHGAVLPCHVMVHVAGHGLQLVGWGHSAGRGRPIKTVATRYRCWYPAEVFKKQPASPGTDLFLAARCMTYLAGGDPMNNRMPAAVPTAMQRFIQTCLLDAARMRPDDAWALHDEFDDLLSRLYGPPKFHPLIMT